MLKIKLPKKPSDFDEKMKPYRDAIAAGMDDSEDPDFPPRWSAYKSHFSRAQFGKCGYCEVFVVVGQDGDVEHYRPKGAVWELKDEGKEVDNLGKVEGRTRKESPTRGYWWTAYHWENYLLSCANCNRKWKRSFFPVAEDPRCRPPDKDIQETELVLNPFGAKDPVNHLEFDADGGVKARNSSPYGRETIRICGLHRGTLNHARLQQAIRAHQLADELIIAIDQGNEQEKRRVLEGFYFNGDERFVHAGLVRAVLKQRCGMSWKDLEEALAE